MITNTLELLMVFTNNLFTSLDLSPKCEILSYYGQLRYKAEVYACEL